MRGDPSLGLVLRRLRVRNRITQAALAERIGMGLPTLCAVERGLRDPGWTEVRAIARALDVSLDELGAAVEQQTQRYVLEVVVP